MFKPISWALLLTVMVTGCSKKTSGEGGVKASANASGSATGAASASPLAARAALARYEGSAIARDPKGTFLLIADEDHSVLRYVSLPISGQAPVRTMKLPGRPAQIVAQPGRVLVTIRNPPLLLALVPAAVTDGSDFNWQEQWRALLPADAWGLAVDRSQTTAFVSSAWANQVSAVNLANGDVRWSTTVSREPRGLLVQNGTLYVNHLIGRKLTKLTELAGTKPTIARFDVPPSPLHARNGKPPARATLGYALAASPNGKRLFVPRHAVGVTGTWGWYGNASIDVWLTQTDRAAIKQGPRRLVRSRDFVDPSEHRQKNDKNGIMRSDWPYYQPMFQGGATVAQGGPTPSEHSVMRQPRDIVYRASSKTLLVASEGRNSVFEYDAELPAPTLRMHQSYTVGGKRNPGLDIQEVGGAPTGIALSSDDKTAYVYCRSTDDLAVLHLAPRDGDKPKGDPLFIRLVADDAHQSKRDPTVGSLQRGRAAYFEASGRYGQGVACATCHPDGRDDGQTWHMFHRELTGYKKPTVNQPFFVAARWMAQKHMPKRKGEQQAPTVQTVPRQTPMLAGRVASEGPYGWEAESKTLADRISHGMLLHRSVAWAEPFLSPAMVSGGLAYYLRHGLVAPPKDTQPLTGAEKQGKAIFESEKAACSSCHNPTTNFSDGSAYRGIVAPNKAFSPEHEVGFKTPSLIGVGHSEPYFHDGSVWTLEQLLKNNGDRMGKTSHLTAGEIAALTAYLRRL